MEHLLKIVACPLDIAWADREENLQAAADIVRRLPRDTDIVVLPELFSTGFITDQAMLTRLADGEDSHPSLDAVRRMAARANAAVCASWVWRDADGAFTNRCFFVEPGGDITYYDKQHLFSLSPEARIFTAGRRPTPVVRFRGWNITMAVCFDTRFPETLRNLPCRYDVLLIPANWPDARRYAWEHLLIARAIENQAYVVGANRSGRDDFGVYSENTTHILDYLGLDLAEPVAGAAPCMSAVLSYNALSDARRGFPVLADV